MNNTAMILSALAAFIAAFASGLYLIILVTRRLSVIHKGTFEELGRPAFGDTSFRQNWRLTKFLLLREYVSLGDKALQRLGDASLIVLVLSCAFAIWLFMLMPAGGIHSP